VHGVRARPIRDELHDRRVPCPVAPRGGASPELRRAAEQPGDHVGRLGDPSLCETLYTKFRLRRTKAGKSFSVDYHRNTLAEAKTFLRWCVKRKFLKDNPLEHVEGVGKRRHGKPQLRIDEARRWQAKALELADAGHTGAVAALMTLYLGMRAGEIVNRVVRDLDDDGHLLWIPKSKTDKGKRELRVPDILHPYLQRLAKGRSPHAPLFGAGHRREWVRYWVRRICEQAKVPFVCSHAMRGAFSSIAIGEAGLASELVAQMLGHTSPSITHQSYATASSVANARQQRVLTVLNGGRR
jgi:integrase